MYAALPRAPYHFLAFLQEWACRFCPTSGVRHSLPYGRCVLLLYDLCTRALLKCPTIASIFRKNESVDFVLQSVAVRTPSKIAAHAAPGPAPMSLAIPPPIQQTQPRAVRPDTKTAARTGSTTTGTLSRQVSTPPLNSGSSTFRALSWKRTDTMTTRRLTSNDESKNRRGMLDWLVRRTQ